MLSNLNLKMKFLILYLFTLLFGLNSATPFGFRPNDDDDTGYLGPPDPIWDPGYPLPKCPDVDRCPVKFHWRKAQWVAPYGICWLCKDLEAHDWTPLPYNSWPQVMKEGICKKWQPPNSYTC